LSAAPRKRVALSLVLSFSRVCDAKRPVIKAREESRVFQILAAPGRPNQTNPRQGVTPS